MPNTKISQIFIVISLATLSQVPKLLFSVGELSRPEVSKSFILINITKAHEPLQVAMERLFVPQKEQKWPAIPCWLFSSLRTWSNPLHPTALQKQCAKEREKLLRILIALSLDVAPGGPQPAAETLCRGRRLLAIPLCYGLCKETTRLVAALLGSCNSRTLPTSSLGFQSPADKRVPQPLSSPEPAWEATQVCTNILGWRQRIQPKEHNSLSMF